MKITVDDRVYAEFQRQKKLLQTNITDDMFLAYILEARARVIEQLAVEEEAEILRGWNQ